MWLEKVVWFGSLCCAAQTPDLESLLYVHTAAPMFPHSRSPLSFCLPSALLPFYTPGYSSRSIRLIRGLRRQWVAAFVIGVAHGTKEAYGGISGECYSVSFD